MTHNVRCIKRGDTHKLIINLKKDLAMILYMVLGTAIMEILIYFYIAFTYLFVIGVKLENWGLPTWNLLFAPLITPLLLGQYMAKKYNS